MNSGTAPTSVIATAIAIAICSLILAAGCSRTDETPEAIQDVMPEGVSEGVPEGQPAGMPDRSSITPASIEVPDGMVYIPGGSTRIGSDGMFVDETPSFEATVDPFLLDRHPVTVAEFSAFVDATGYETEAEGFGNSAVLDGRTHAWTLIDGATWRKPLGPDGPDAKDDHPVTHVSWNDATAYADWAGKRLPTEIEWEHAARSAGATAGPYWWGSEPPDKHNQRANIWQGEFPLRNTGDDGFLFTSPVGAFGETELGLTDMAGNVWEWTADWFRPYSERERPYEPDASSERVQRGGSFLCHASWCQGYRVSARSRSTPESSLFHVGFRCAKDV